MTWSPRACPTAMMASRWPARSDAGGGFIPKGAKNVEVAKDLMKYWMQPKVMNDNLKAGLGRWCRPCRRSSRMTRGGSIPRTRIAPPMCSEAVLGPTIPDYEGFNPAWGQVTAEQVWGQAHADVIKNGMTPEQAIDKAFKRAEQIFSQVTF